MCSLKVAILTAVLLQVKTFVLYPRHYDQEVLPQEVQIFFKGLGNKVLTSQIFWAAVLVVTLIALKHLMSVSSMWPIEPLVSDEILF